MLFLLRTLCTRSLFISTKSRKFDWISRMSTSNPTTSVQSPSEQAKKFIEEHRVAVFSKSYCPFCTKVKSLFDANSIGYSSLELDLIDNGPAIQQSLYQSTGQNSVPNVFVNGSHLGGCDDTVRAHAEGRLLRLVHAQAAGDGQYDYDVVVVGGGSGGLACSKQLAELGARVAVCDFVKPSPQGTSWGLGGTCVNVGCIPKKLMHRAALLKECLDDAKDFGWDFRDEKHNWEECVTQVTNHVRSLNWKYRVSLTEKKVKYLNAHVELLDAHKLQTTDKNNNKNTITTRYIVLAMGGRPSYPTDVPGAVEYGITSDDVFRLSNPPGRTLIVGASYIALECAGFLRALGYDVTVYVRSILLRGFDRQMAELIGDDMAEHGVRFIHRCVPTSIELVDEGPPRRLRVHAVKTDMVYEGDENIAAAEELIEEEYNTVLFATGRRATTRGLGLEKIGVLLDDKNDKVICDESERTSVDNIFAIGDIVNGKPELTPVAIQAGKLLAKRLMGSFTTLMDYVNVPTTVFTPMEYGCVGVTEEMAIDLYKDDISVFHQKFTALEHVLGDHHSNGCYVKLICVTSEKNRVIGLHVLSPNAGEITQGFALAIKLGATKEDFDNVVGIHPTIAEQFTTLNITKASGLSPDSKGC